MAYWDYRVWLCDQLVEDDKMSIEDYLESVLNLNGADGWELATAVVVRVGDGSKIAYHFKRKADIK